MTELPTVLVAEDSSVIRAVLRQQLEEQGYRVVEADDGHAALAACRSALPDAVLLDIEMPGLDGHQVLAALKADSALADVPVVFLTGRNSTEDVVEGLRLGAHDYLRKPFEGSELLARVSAAVRVKTLQDQLRARNVELDRLSRTDTLTGLANRREVDERLRHLTTERDNGSDLAAGVLLLDLDHFKHINDTFGHDGGDAVLRELADRVRSVLVDDHLAGRWGGEEFIVVMADVDGEAIASFGESLRRRVADTPFMVTAGRSTTVTVSGGWAIAGRHSTPELLVSQADAALYEAKAAGRNQILASMS